MLTAPTAPRVEHRTDVPIGVGTPIPRLSWQVPAAEPGYAQAGYEVEVTRGDGSVTWHVVESPDQVLVPWPAAPLASRERAAVRVRVRGHGWSGWSAPTTVEAGLLDPSDWSARFVSPTGIGGVGEPAPVLSATLDLPDREIVKARLYITAHGLYEATLNGRRVGDELLAPGWTSYQHRLRYRTHDVTDLVRPGRNEVSALLGNGWFRGRLGWEGRRAYYGDRLALLAQLEVTTADGAVHVLATDAAWGARNSRVLADDLYDGQTTDLRPDWSPGETHAVEVVDADLARLVGPEGPPVRVTGTVAATQLTTTPSGATLIDFGQNLVGWVRLTVRGLSPGHEVTVRHAEVLDGGELGTRPLRTARATDTYLVAGEPEETLAPSLTFHGFRYAELTGVTDLRPEDVTAVVVGSDLRRTGWFESSHPLLNRFHENVVWGMRGNFVDVPTDCPQRDERLGWTGDLMVFAPTASFLFDSAGFLSSWLADLAADQASDGAVPFVVPDILHNGMTAAGWGDAAVMAPWTVYERAGDVGLLARQLPSMRSWVDCVDRLAGDDGVWSGGFQFGDWLDPTAAPDEPFRAKADPDVVATAFLVRSSQLLAQAGRVVGDDEVARHAHQVHERSLAGFRHEFVTPAGRVLSDAQTTYALALQFGLLATDEQRQHAAARLADLVRISGFRIATGFLGTPLVTDALAENGQLATAYRLLLQTGCPSWLYSVTMGATTVWERWDSLLPDGTINPGQMTSFNHYALGAVADWLHRTVAGLAPAAPGYRRIRVAPQPGGGLTQASARHLTPYGEARVAWTLDGDQLTVDARVPVGTRAEVDLPGAQPLEVGHGEHHWTVTLPAPGRRRPRTARDLMDDEPSWRRFHEAAVAARVGGMLNLVDEAAVADRLGPVLDEPVRVLPDLLTLGGADSGRERLLALLGDLLDDAPGPPSPPGKAQPAGSTPAEPG